MREITITIFNLTSRTGFFFQFSSVFIVSLKQAKVSVHSLTCLAVLNFRVTFRKEKARSNIFNPLIARIRESEL